MNRKDEGSRIDAMLRHLAGGRDTRDFPGTPSEKLALVRTADARGLIAWRKAPARYEVTAAGWSRLAPRRHFGLASLLVSTAIGAVVGAASLAIVWLPDDRSHRPTRGQFSASVSHLGRPGVAQIPRPLETGPRDSALPSTDSAVAAADATPELELVKADQPASGETDVGAGLTGAKPAAARKSRHKTVHRHRRGQIGPAWANANPWRTQRFRYAGYGGQGTWLGYR
jgi:hypothetical protein